MTTPYLYKFLGLFGSVLFSETAIEIILKVYDRKPPALPVVIAGGIIGLIVCMVVVYYWQVHEINSLVGCYVTGRKLKSIDGPSAYSFGLAPFYKYYRQRPIDDEIRNHLRVSHGVVILGKPSSGKTRAAIEAIAGSDENAKILAFLDPGRLDPDRIEKIILPRMFVLFPKPDLVLFIDRAEKFGERPFNDLFIRLRDQCSDITIVATCRSGADAKVLSEGDLGTLLRDLPRVEVGPLDAQSAADIYSHVLKDKPPPLTLDATLPGLILRGSGEFQNRYEGLPHERRRVITALSLAAACGDNPCDPQFFKEILQRVLGQDVADLKNTLAEMQSDYIVALDGKGKIAVQNDEWFFSDFASYYRSVHAYMEDLGKVESLLQESGDADRLLQLGLTYFGRFREFDAARRALVASLQTKKSTFAYTSLARVYMWLKEAEKARDAILEAVEATTDPNKKALALVAFADEVLYNVNDREKAEGWYAQALQYATDPATVATINWRIADSLAALKRYAEAEPIYRDHLAAAKSLEKGPTAARLFLCMIAQDRVAEARMFLREKWSGLTRGERLALVLAVFANAEGFFPDAPSLNERTWRAVWDEYRDLARAQADSIVIFADTCLCGGFLAPAIAAYLFTLENADQYRLDPRTVALLLVNTGAAFRDLLDFGSAREAFDRAKSVAEKAALEDVLGCVIAGLADCDLMGQDRVADAKRQYEEALKLGTQGKDGLTTTWAHMGLGDVANANSDWSLAKKEHSSMQLIGNSVSGYSRNCLGLARACFELGEFDDAKYFIETGIASSARLDYRFRQNQFLELRELVAAAQGESSAPHVR